MQIWTRILEQRGFRDVCALEVERAIWNLGLGSGRPTDFTGDGVQRDGWTGDVLKFLSD